MKRLWSVFFLLALLLALNVSAAADEVQDLTGKCNITVSSGDAKPLTDGNIKTYWEAAADGASILVDLPENANPGGMMIEWFSEPEDYEIRELDAAGTELSRRTLADSFRAIINYYPLNSAVTTVVISVPKGTQVASVRLCTQGEMPQSVQIWQPPVEKADIMLVSTHQDDEELFFGGAIPYYDVVRDADMVVVYMTTCGRLRRGEALNGLWAMGVRTYPEFLNMKDQRVSSIDAGIDLWGGKDAILERLVETIRKYRPEVIVTHDLNGEYGHNQHKITALAMEYAIEAAADETQYSQSAQEYGAWQVKKLYLHLSDENTLYMNWNTPAEALGGKTPLEVAKIGFLQHKSQQDYFSMEHHGKKYDNTKFGLTYTTVGLDVEKNDFLENIPTSTPEPVPTPEPTPDPTSTPAPVQVTATPAPELTPEPQPVVESRGGVAPAWIVAGIAAVALIGALGVAVVKTLGGNRRKRHKRRGRR